MKIQEIIPAANSWLEVDKNGLKQTLKRKGISWAILELAQNSWDEDSTRVDIGLTKPVNGKSTLTCRDNAPKRTHEEQKELQRLMTARTRAKILTTVQYDKIVEIGKACDSVDEFHQANLRNVDAEQLKNWLTLQERVDDQLHWMRTYKEQDPHDEAYVGLDEGWDCLKNFIETIGFIKDGFHYSGQVLKDFEPGWPIWADKNYNDPIWGKITAYYKDPQRLAALCEENEPTRVRALYGLRIGIPEYHYTLWCQNVAQQQAQTLGVAG